MNKLTLSLAALILAQAGLAFTTYWTPQSQTSITNTTTYWTVEDPMILFNSTTYYAWFVAENATGTEIRFTNSTNKQGFDLGMSTNIDASGARLTIAGPTVVLNSSTFTMYFVAENTTRDTEIFYATSVASSANFGRSWTGITSTGVFNNSSEVSIDDPAVIIDTDGTWKMWYHADNKSDTIIKYATSTDAGATWTQAGFALVNSSTNGEIWIGEPFVFRDTYQDVRVYKLYYTSIDGNGNVTIKYANSTDGTAWTRQGHTNITNSTDRIDVGSVSVLRNETLAPGTASALEMWFFEEQSGSQTGNLSVRFTNQSNAMRLIPNLNAPAVARSVTATLTVIALNTGSTTLSALNGNTINISLGGTQQNSTFEITPQNGVVTLASGANATFNWSVTPSATAGGGAYIIEVKFNATGGAGNEVTVGNTSIGLTVSVPVAGGGGGGGGGAAGPSGESVTVAEAAAGSTYTARFTQDFVTEIEITPSKRITVKIRVIEPRTRPAALDVLPDVFEYVDIEATEPATSFSKIKIRFKVAKQELLDARVLPSEVRLGRFDGTSWQELPTSIISLTGDTYIFSGVSPGFSLFAAYGNASGTDCRVQGCAGNLSCFPAPEGVKYQCDECTVKCANNQELDSRNCLCKPKVCKPGTELDANGNCVAKPVSCPPGQQYDEQKKACATSPQPKIAGFDFLTIGAVVVVILIILGVILVSHVGRKKKVK